MALTVTAATPVPQRERAANCWGHTATSVTALGVTRRAAEVAVTVVAMATAGGGEGGGRRW